MKIKVAEASGLVLDWLVAKCEGIELLKAEHGQQYVYSSAFGNCYDPSQGEWNIAGPIIERGRICVDFMISGNWLGMSRKEGTDAWCYGPTPLTAAMRCYVMSKLGEEVEVPDELG